MRILICGGRDFNDKRIFNTQMNCLDEIYKITEICEGGAKGADTLARDWALANEIACATYHANWSLYGQAAGPIRNQQMLDSFKPDLVVAFPGGRGTAHMVSIAKKAHIRVQEV